MTAAAGASRAATALVIISGMSGSGKTIALRALEDAGYYCVDNLPPRLIPDLVTAMAQPSSDTRGAARSLAIGVDARNRPDDLEGLPQILGDLAARGVRYRLAFLDAEDSTLVKRFAETRRRHPLTQVSLAEAIAEERQLLAPLAALADLRIDTSTLNVHQLRRQLFDAFAGSEAAVMLLFESFAYRRGVPAESDFVFDARSLPNPHWIPELRVLSGRDAAVVQWFAQHAGVADFIDRVRGLVSCTLDAGDTEQRRSLAVMIGCTGGRHRSVFIAETLASHFRAHHARVHTFHRELE